MSDYWQDPNSGEADETSEHKLGVFPSPKIEDCPVAFLGHYKGYVVFATPEGEIREERAKEIASMLRVDIFNRREGQQFLNNWRDPDDKLQKDLAAVWFVRMCREAGYWDRSRPQRGLGVWPGADGDVILHRGHELVIYHRDGPVETLSIAEALRIRNGPIYALNAPAPAPGDPCSVEDGKWLRHALDCWNWAPLGDDGLTGADVCAGWLMAGLLGSVAPFRPHLLTFALFGSGKTTLMRLVHAAQSALAGDILDNFTPAGLANDLGGRARPVIIDEAEASPHMQGAGLIEGALNLIRRMATGHGAVRKMGTIGGGSLTQTAVGAVMMGAVNPVKLGPADASRIAEAKLLPLDAPYRSGQAFRPVDDAAIDVLVKKARELAPGFLARALIGAPRYLADVAMIKAAFRDQGESPRSADLAASLVAGHCLLTHDEPLTADQAAEEAQFWRGLLAARVEAEMVSNPGADCLAHLLAWVSGQHLHDRVVTLGELVTRWARAYNTSEDVEDIETVLREHGIRPIWRPDDDKPNVVRPWLLVAHHAPSLNRIFERTEWRDWRRSLGYLDALGPEYATRAAAPTRFGIGVRQRATAVPLTPWLGKGAERVRSADRSAQEDDFT